MVTTTRSAVLTWTHGKTSKSEYVSGTSALTGRLLVVENCGLIVKNRKPSSFAIVSSATTVQVKASVDDFAVVVKA